MTDAGTSNGATDACASAATGAAEHKAVPTEGSDGTNASAQHPPGGMDSQIPQELPMPLKKRRGRPPKVSPLPNATPPSEATAAAVLPDACGGSVPALLAPGSAPDTAAGHASNTAVVVAAGAGAGWPEEAILGRRFSRVLQVIVPTMSPDAPIHASHLSHPYHVHFLHHIIYAIG